MKRAFFFDASLAKVFKKRLFSNLDEAPVLARRIFSTHFLCILYEARSQVGICESPVATNFEDFGTYMFQSVEKYLDVVGTWLTVRLKADDSYF